MEVKLEKLKQIVYYVTVWIKFNFSFQHVTMYNLVQLRLDYLSTDGFLK